MRHKYTHKGWFGLCPVYFSGLDTDGPVIRPRWSGLWPLFFLSEHVFGFLMIVMTAVNSRYEPEWPLLVTDELETPLWIED